MPTHNNPKEHCSGDGTKTEVALLESILTNIFGTDLWDDSAKRTAERVLAFWKEYQPDVDYPFKFTTFPAEVNQMITVTHIQFSSLCAHHLLPFYGLAHVAYVPNELMIGVSKIPRLVDHWAKRPCTQEMLTKHVADDLKHSLAAMGVAVVIEARHTCMACRGVRKHDAGMITSEMRGIFLTAGEARNEFLLMISRNKV